MSEWFIESVLKTVGLKGPVGSNPTASSILKVKSVIDSFTGPNRFLSNFWPAKVMFEGEEYSSVEHAYVAAKTTDEEARKTIRGLTPGQAKRFGRSKIQLREDWEDIKLHVMRELVSYKFFHNPDLSQLLLDTGDQELIEGNTWGDTYWGVCFDVGLNNLGKILMEIRSELKNKS